MKVIDLIDLIDVGARVRSITCFACAFKAMDLFSKGVIDLIDLYFQHFKEEGVKNAGRTSIAGRSSKRRSIRSITPDKRVESASRSRACADRPELPHVDQQVDQVDQLGARP